MKQKAIPTGDSNSPEKEKDLSPRSLPLPANPESASEEKVRTIARRKSIISTLTAVGIKMAFYHGRVERVKKVQARVAQMQKDTTIEDQINREKETLERETAALKQSLQEFIGEVGELEKVIEEEPHTAVEIIQISDTYLKEWSYEAANTLLKSCPEATITKLIKAYLSKEVSHKRAQQPFPQYIYHFEPSRGTLPKQAPVSLSPQTLRSNSLQCIFHKNVGTIGRKEHSLRFIDQAKAKEQTLRVIAKLKGHLEKSRLPEPLRDMYRTAYHEVESKHPGLGLSRIASLLFLQTINPAISSGTKRFQFGEIEYGEKDEGNAIVIAKVMQSLVNRLSPSGDLFAEINAAFIDREQVKVEEIACLLL